MGKGRESANGGARQPMLVRDPGEIGWQARVLTVTDTGTAVGAVSFPRRTVMNSQQLEKYSEITLTVSGRNTGRKISIPVWFVVEGEQLYLLPVKGSDTQWYRNIVQNPNMQIGVSGEQAEFRAVPMTEAEAIQSVIEKFREKYGAGDVKKYYSKFDVAVQARAA